MTEVRRPSQPKEKPQIPQFRVETSGMESVVNWVRMCQELTKSGFIGDDLSVNLAELPLHDNVLDGIHVQTDYDPEEDLCRFSSDFYLTNGNTQAGMIRLLPIAGMQVYPEQSLPEEEPTIDLKRMAQSLNKDRDFKKRYQAVHDQDNDELQIKDKSSQSEPGKDGLLFYKQEGHPLLPGSSLYTLRSGIQADEGLDEQLPTVMNRHGEVTQMITSALYAQKKQPEPNKTMKIKPPRNLDRQVDTALQTSRMQTQMLALSSSGEIMGEGGIDSFIEQRILMKEPPDVTFEDIGGNKEAREELESIVFAIKHPDVYRRWGTRPPKGVLLYGPTGTGKTLLVKAAAHESGIPLLNVDIGDVLNPLYGRTEQIIQAVFEKAHRMGQAMVLFDELDALGSKRGMSSEMKGSIVSVMLQKIEGLRNTDGVTVLATTNRPEMIDEALLRPGRLNRHIEVKLPTEPERLAIFDIHQRKALQIAGTENLDDIFDPLLDKKQIIRMAHNFSGADIQEIIRRVLEEKVKQEKRGLHPGPVTTEDLLHVIASYEPIRLTRQKKLGYSVNGQ